MCVSLGATGCTASTRGPATPTVPANGAEESGPITLVTARDLSQGGVRQKLIDQWNTAHPDHKVNVVELPSNADLQRSQMLAAEQSGEPSYDVLNLDVTWTAEFATDGALRPLDPAVLREDSENGALLPGVKQTVQYGLRGGQSQVWAVPFNSDAGLLYYRADVLQKFGITQPPRTWQEMQTDFQKVVKKADPKSDHIPSAAYTTQLGDYEGLTVNTVEAVASSDSGHADVSRDASGLAALVSHFNDDTPPTILPAAHPPQSDITDHGDEDASVQAFIRGDVLFMRNWPYAYNVLAAGKLEGSFGVTALPSLDGAGPGRSVLGGQNLAIAAHSTKPNLARSLIEFLTSRSSENCLLEYGGFAATRTDAYSDRSGCVLPSPPPVTGNSENANAGTLYSDSLAWPKNTLLGGFNQDSPLTVLETALRTAVARPVTPYYARVTQVIQKAAAQALDDQASMQGPAPGAVQAIASALPAQIRAAEAGR
ncbi:MAG: extracellular solute-binding protein [Catenulispora sp.]|nr:extracellular solute-binding protein [Catenulispora sp.]